MKQFWKSMLKSPSGVIGLVILLVAVSVAAFGPMLFPNSPWRMVQRPFLPPFTLATVPLGTDGSFVATDSVPSTPSTYRAVYVDATTGLPLASLVRTPVQTR
jgi:hypothetical protein